MKYVKLLIVLVVSVAIMSGCNVNKVNQENVTEKNVVGISEIPANSASWTEISRYTGDVDADGIDENVILTTSAERDENGEVLWNDGQNWLLYVDDREGSYVLLNNFVQLGNVYFEVFDYYTDNGTKPCINVITSTSAGFSLKNFSFSKDKGGFEETVLYDANNAAKAGINRRFTSIPDIH